MDLEKKYMRPDEASLRMQLTEEQYAVTQEGIMEPPYFNAYWDEDADGLYVDVVTDEPLFLSTDKFRSGGWPAFYHPIRRDSVFEREERSGNDVKIEIVSRIGRTHLGRVYDDGPIEHGGRRYCVNSASLRFIPKERLKAEGYDDFMHFFN